MSTYPDDDQADDSEVVQEIGLSRKRNRGKRKRSRKLSKILADQPLPSNQGIENNTTATIAHTLVQSTEPSLKRSRSDNSFGNVVIKKQMGSEHNGRNPIVVLNDKYQGKLIFLEKVIGTSQHPEYECIVEIDGIICNKTVACSKKMAKRKAAEGALKTLEGNNTTATIAHTLDQSTEPSLKRSHSDNSFGNVVIKKQMGSEHNGSSAIVVLNEKYQGKLKYLEKVIGTRQHPEHECIVEIDGIICNKTVACSKKMAKRMAAEGALKTLVEDEEPKEKFIMDAKSVKILRLAGIKPSEQLSKKNIMYHCTLCRKAIGSKMGSDGYLRSHVIGNVHLHKMANLLHIDEWEKVMKVLRGKDEKRFSKTMDLSDFDIDREVLRHVVGRKFFCIACEKVVFIPSIERFEDHICGIKHKTSVEEKGLFNNVQELRTSPLPKDISNLVPYEYGSNAIYEDESMFQHQQYIQDKTSINIEEEYRAPFETLSEENILELSGIKRTGKSSYYCSYCEKYLVSSIKEPNPLPRHCCGNQHLRTIAKNLDLFSWQELMTNLGYNLFGSSDFRKLDSTTHAALEVGGLRQVDEHLFYCTVCLTTVTFRKPEVIKEHISSKKHARRMQNISKTSFDSNQLFMALEMKYSACENESEVPKENEEEPEWYPNQFSSSRDDAGKLSGSINQWNAHERRSNWKCAIMGTRHNHQKRIYEDDGHMHDDVLNYGDMLSSSRIMHSNSSLSQNTKFTDPSPNMIDKELVKAADEIKRLKEEASDEITKLRMEAEILREENLQLKAKRLVEEADALREENRKHKCLPAENKPRPKLPNPSWNEDLASLRRETRRVGRKAKRSCQDADWDYFIESQKAFKKEIRKSKRQSRRDLAKLQHETSQSSKSYYSEIVEAHHESQNNEMAEIKKEINQKLFGGNKFNNDEREHPVQNPKFYGNNDNKLKDMWNEGEKRTSFSEKTLPHYGSKCDEPSTTTHSKYDQCDSNQYDKLLNFSGRKMDSHYSSQYDQPSTSYSNEYNTNDSRQSDQPSTSYGNKYDFHDSSQYEKPSTSYGNKHGSQDSILYDQPSASYVNKHGSHDSSQYDKPSTSYGNEYGSRDHRQYEQPSASYVNKHGSHDSIQYDKPSKSYGNKYGSRDNIQYDQPSTSYGNKYGSHENRQYDQSSTSFGNRCGNLDSSSHYDQHSKYDGSRHDSLDDKDFNRMSSNYEEKRDRGGFSNRPDDSWETYSLTKNSNANSNRPFSYHEESSMSQGMDRKEYQNNSKQRAALYEDDKQNSSLERFSYQQKDTWRVDEQW